MAEQKNLEDKIYFIVKVNQICIEEIYAGKLNLACAAYKKKGNESWEDIMDYYIYNMISETNPELLTRDRFSVEAKKLGLSDKQIEDLFNYELVSEEEMKSILKCDKNLINRIGSN